MPPESHRAWYDDDGNIVLPGVEGASRKEKVEEEPVKKPKVTREHVRKEETPIIPDQVFAKTETSDSVMEEVRKMPEMIEEEPVITSVKQQADAVWEVTDPTWKEVEKERPAMMEGWKELRGKVHAVASDLLVEGGNQYRTSIDDGHSVLRRSLITIRQKGAEAWAFLTQPVWVPGRRDTPKKYNRGTLFILDVVRFGGTFAFLFTVLFSALNYQSFWQIVKARVDPLASASANQALEQDLNETLTDKLRRIPALAIAGGTNGDLLNLVPDVGPPVPTLIIPKLGMNVPIVIPSNAALLREDWKKLEEDIQSGLQQGVVHYPGTARPGQAGNFFVTGHSSYFPWDPGRYKSIFARLGDLDPGDEYWVYYGGDKYRYRVTAKREVRPNDVTVLDQPTNKRIGTLMTCTPVGTTLRRLIIDSQEVDPVTDQPLGVGDHGHQDEAPKVKVEMLPI